MNLIASKIQRMLKSKSSSAATLQTLLTRIFILVLNVATGVITARFLGADGRGEQAAIIMWPMFLASLLTLGMHSALVYNLKRYQDEESELFSAALLLSIALGLLASAIGILFMPLWMKQYSPEIIRIAQWFMLTAPAFLISLVCTGALEAKGHFTISNQSRYLGPLVTLVILSGLVLTGTLTPLTSGLAYVLPSVPITFWMLIQLFRFFHFTLRSLRESYKRLLSYSLRSYGIDLLGTLSAQIGSVLVIGLLTPADMGLYAVAINLSRTLGLLQSSVITVLLPRISARPVPEVVALTGRIARITGTGLMAIAIVVMLICPILLQLLYGHEFLKAVSVLRILLLDSVISCTSWVFTQAFMAVGRPGLVTILQAIGLGLTVPLTVMFVPLWGLEGAGLALLCSSGLRFLLALAGFPFVLKVQLPGLIVTREDILFLRQRFQVK